MYMSCYIKIDNWINDKIVNGKKISYHGLFAVSDYEVMIPKSLKRFTIQFTTEK